MGDQLALFIDFENVAIWAEEHFFDLDLNRLMEYLRSRGPVVVKRAYGDWSRFPKYREVLLENSIDLVQMYSVRGAKNRADIRLALDAFETVTVRPHVSTTVIVSGDSDFGALASKLREYGQYILGIGPRSNTHALLVKACDEFVYLETVIGREREPLDSLRSERETARRLLTTALARFGQQGALPVLAAQLKSTMLSMDPTFNEDNLGYDQFRSWLEDNDDLTSLFFKGLQMYVAPADFKMPREFAPVPRPRSPVKAAVPPPPQGGLLPAYQKIFDQVLGSDAETRRDVLRDIHDELSERPGEWSIDSLSDRLEGLYEARGLARSKTLLLKLLSPACHPPVFELKGPARLGAPLWLAREVDSLPTFVRRVESRLIYSAVVAGLDTDAAELAAVLLNDRTQSDYVQGLIDDLLRGGTIVQVGSQYRLPAHGENPLRADPNLRVAIRDLEGVRFPPDLECDVATARELAQSAMAKRSDDFAGAAHDFLLASRLLWDAYERQEPGATLDEVRWCLASYASVKAGELSQVLRAYAAAQPYYLAFFTLVQESAPIWHRMRGLSNPMLHFYWKNLAREIGFDVTYTMSPAKLAVHLATHSSAELQERWRAATEKVAAVNPDVLRRVVEQIRLAPDDSPQDAAVAAEIEAMLPGGSTLPQDAA